MDSPEPRAHEEFDELRPAAFGIAYRMLGSVSEAEDVVQEAFLRLDRAREGGERRRPRAYLSTVVSERQHLGPVADVRALLGTPTSSVTERRMRTSGPARYLCWSMRAHRHAHL